MVPVEVAIAIVKGTLIEKADDRGSPGDPAGGARGHTAQLTRPGPLRCRRVQVGRPPVVRGQLEPH